MSITAKDGIHSRPINIATVPAKPVLWWATLGAIALVVMVITIGQWIMSPEFRPVPKGSDPISESTEIWIRVVEAFNVSCVLLLGWFYLVKPWIKAGHVTWDGMFLLACGTMYYQDPIDNYFNFNFAYNGYFHNMGSWSNFIPGWQSPRAENFGEPFLFMGMVFFWFMFGASVVGCWLLNKFKSWFSNMSFLGHVCIILLLTRLLDFVVEVIFTHTELMAYVGVYGPLSLWAGTPGQFPLYESTATAAITTACVLIRYSRDDQGYSFLERGMQYLTMPAPVRRLISFCAMVAAIQLFTLVFFYGQFQLFALKVDTFAKYPSYRLTEICGKNTPYACPSKEVPMPKKGSLAIPPDDPRLSPESKLN